MQNYYVVVLTMSVVCVLYSTPAHAGWNNDGYEKRDSACESIVHSPGGNAGNGSNTINSAALHEIVVQVPSGPSGSASQISALTQRYSWSGGGTPSSSFSANGSGTLRGRADVTAYAYGTASAAVDHPWSSLGVDHNWSAPDAQINPMGFWPVTTLGNPSTASFNWSLTSSVSGGFSSGPPAGSKYDLFAYASYAFTGT